jgi:glycosyltransferase involved in cell wall biosynthesis
VIDFISNLPKDLWTGGFSAMNAAAFSAISAYEEVRYVGPIDPPVILHEKALSKTRRLMGRQGTFFFFSGRRLRAIAKEFKSADDSDARLTFFHGFTPWILTMPGRPYIAWSDCTFRDYVDIFSDRRQFEEGDLERIATAEVLWLRGAQRVLFTSVWAANRAIDQCALDPSRVASVGIFGNVDMPEQDAFTGGKNFVFASTNFVAKGGEVVLSAFQIVRSRHADATLTIIGDRPKHGLVSSGITCTGLLRKEVPSERQLMQEILGQARALVHPTTTDIAPLSVVEAAYVGCPVISSRRFAIPELVDDNRTGLLLDDSGDASAVAEAMCWMLENPAEYERMRGDAWKKGRESTRSNFAQRLRRELDSVIGQTQRKRPAPKAVHVS